MAVAHGLARRAILGLVAAAVTTTLPARAAEGEAAEAAQAPLWRSAVQEAGITGSVRAGLWSSNRRLDDETGVAVPSAWLRLDRKLGPVGVYVDGFFSREDALGNAPRGVNRLREAYLEGRSGDWDFRVGRQIVAWGRTDRLNPTDVITPRDLSLLAPEIDEDRFGALAAKAGWALRPDTSLVMVWVPDFTPNRVALSPRPGLQVVDVVPDSRRTWAVKLDRSGGAVDWSVSAFDGFDLSGDLSLAAAAPGLTTLALRHHRLRMLGADVATTVGANRYAAEVAYARTEDLGGGDFFRKNPFIYAVAGLEHDFGNTLNLIVQTFGRHVIGWRDAWEAPPALRPLAVQQAVLSSQADRFQAGITARLGRKWLNETLETELAGSALLTRTGFSLRPRVMYAASDNLKLVAGMEWFRGSDRTTFGLLERNRTVFGELRWIF